MKTPNIRILTLVLPFIAAIGFAVTQEKKTQPEPKPVTAAPVLTEAQELTLSETYVGILENAQQMNAAGCTDLSAKQNALNQKLQQLQANYCPPVGSKLFHLDHSAPVKDKPAEWSCKETVQPPQPAKTAVPAAPAKK